jgi:hypothetical protein
LTVADGVEMVIEPGRAGLTPEQVRQFIKGVMAVFGQVSGVQSDAGDSQQLVKKVEFQKGTKYEHD